MAASSPDPHECLRLVLGAICCWMALAGCHGYHFTSTDAMEDLYDLELALVHRLEDYLREQQNIMTLLSGRYEQAVLAVSSVTSRESYVANPINSFALLRRLTTEWPKTLSLMEHDTINNLTLPTADDFAGAARALTRLQDVYNLSAKTLAAGHLPNTHRRAVLTAADCVVVAQIYCIRQDYSLATDWLLEALDKVFQDRSCPPGLVLENLFITTCFEGDQQLSSFYLQQLLSRYPLYVPPDHLVQDYNLAVRANCDTIAAERRALKGKSVPELDDEEIDEYHSMCRGKALRRLKGLRCHLVHYHHHHLRIQPFKLEELHLDPPVLMIHQAMSDQEIHHFQQATVPRMKRAKIVMPNGSVTSALYRTSHIAWVDDEEDAVSRRVSRRVAAMTDLSVETAELNQVSNYGLAGEYITHMDAIDGVNLTQGPDSDGNRLATFMVYMSDVPWGGHTVFPDLGLSVKPRKGAALFWFNLDHDGSTDYRMRHASCPVLVGNKWVLNKWLHERCQDLRPGHRPPCLRHQNDTRMHYYL